VASSGLSIVPHVAIAREGFSTAGLPIARIGERPGPGAFSAAMDAEARTSTRAPTSERPTSRTAITTEVPWRRVPRTPHGDGDACAVL
jgi:hypothetical protein